jgi:20S proteasome alpha/beta subunit
MLCVPHWRQGSRPRLLDSRPPSRKGPPEPVTVAIACLFVWRPEGKEAEFAVLTVADRMLTLDEIEWEPKQAKTWTVTNRVHVLIAGDYTHHARAMNRIKENDYEEDINIHNFARLYQDALAEQQRFDAEAHYLQPLGITLDDLRDRRKMCGEQAEFLSRQVQNHLLIDASALIVGCDDYQGHIYTATPKELVCDTEIGWAVIGTGYYPAASEFTAAQYDKNSEFQVALFTAYRAKKTAESASFVGKKTDIIQITRGGYSHLNNVVMETLERANQHYSLGVSHARVSALHEIKSSLIPAEESREMPLNPKGPPDPLPDYQAEQV